MNRLTPIIQEHLYGALSELKSARDTAGQAHPDEVHLHNRIDLAIRNTEAAVERVAKHLKGWDE